MSSRFAADLRGAVAPPEHGLSAAPRSDGSVYGGNDGNGGDGGGGGDGSGKAGKQLSPRRQASLRRLQSSLPDEPVRRRGSSASGGLALAWEASAEASLGRSARASAGVEGGADALAGCATRRARASEPGRPSGGGGGAATLA
eukprot:141769-Chlamydomonas_euryale.AAC.1